jgi:hypothetical protein
MSRGITVNRDSEGQVREVRYLTDDRDARDGRRLELCIGWGNNGDWYVVTVPEGERGVSAVRLCTSGGASSVVPGFVPLIAEAFRKLLAASGEMRDGDQNPDDLCYECKVRTATVPGIRARYCEPCYLVLAKAKG